MAERWRALAGGLLAVSLLAGCGGSASGEVAGAVLTEPYSVPPTPLTDTGGERFSLAGDTDKRLTLVFFGYTHCPDICQTVMANVTSGLTRLDDADREQVDVVFVTTDPARNDEVPIVWTEGTSASEFASDIHTLLGEA